MLQTPISGAQYLYKGFKLLSLPSIRPYVLIPLAINALLFSLLIAWGINTFSEFTNWINMQIPDWLSWLRFILWPVFAIGILLITSHTFALIGTLLAAPWNSQLAKRVESELTGIIDHSDSGTFLKNSADAIKREGQKLMFYLPKVMFCFVMFFIPVVNLTVPFIWATLTAWMLAVEYTDYPFENHHHEFKETKTQLMMRPFHTLGFGGIIMGLYTIPILNWFVMPAAVAGATAFYVDRMSQNYPPSQGFTDLFQSN